MVRLLLVSLLFLAPFSAWAQEEEDDTQKKTEAAAKVEEIKTRAMKMARRGKLEEGLELLETALPLAFVQDENLLFNLQLLAHELKRCDKVILYVSGFLYAAPADAEVPKLEKRRQRCIKSMKKLGQVTIEGTPERAEIYMNNVLTGRSPMYDLKLPAGSYQLRAVADEHKDYNGSFSVDAGLTTTHKIKLKKKVYRGDLIVTTDPPGGTVYLNEVKVGKAPYKRAGLSTKRYLVRVEKKGMDRWIRYVMIERDNKLKVHVRMENTGTTVPIPPIPDL